MLNTGLRRELLARIRWQAACPDLNLPKVDDEALRELLQVCREDVLWANAAGHWLDAIRGLFARILQTIERKPRPSRRYDRRSKVTLSYQSTRRRFSLRAGETTAGQGTPGGEPFTSSPAL
ncbi:MAG: hypothetical protein U0798_08305 [Gemmataceae bacterium]